MKAEVIAWFLLTSPWMILGTEDKKRLYDDLMQSYNKLLRPSIHQSDVLTIRMRLRLSQIIDVAEKDQIMTTSIWLHQEWFDPKLVWDPDQYKGVTELYVPSELIWLPDIVLYNNADSSYNITTQTKATVRANGTVIWEPPAIFKSMCIINVQWFPFDDQECELKFGSWTYDETLMDLQHIAEDVEIGMEEDLNHTLHEVQIVREGVDISDYHTSVEWDLVRLPATRHSIIYSTCCPNKFVDITYGITIRRKPLFYTVNLISPCVGISFLTILVFYLPSDSGEKITLCISILVALTVFFLLLTDIIPTNSIVLPLIGKYLLFTMVMVTLSVVVTVVSLNLHWRSPSTHRMPRWVKILFLRILPRYLMMRRPIGEDEESFRRVSSKQYPEFLSEQQLNKLCTKPHKEPGTSKDTLDVDDPAKAQREKLRNIYYSPPVLKAFRNMSFIADLLKKKDKNDKIDEDWKYVAMVLDRLFLWIFSGTCFFGTVIILLQAPAFYDPTPVIPFIETP